VKIWYDCECPLTAASGSVLPAFAGAAATRSTLESNLGWGVRRQTVGSTKPQERSVTVAANGDAPQLAGRRRITDALMPGSGRSIVSPTAASSYPEVCLCALR
jgi:hypothetical protein